MTLSNGFKQRVALSNTEAHQSQPTNPNQPMTYEESVLAFADSEGKLNAFNVRQLINEHGLTVSDWVSDCEARGLSDDLLDDAQAILTWLGY